MVFFGSLPPSSIGGLVASQTNLLSMSRGGLGRLAARRLPDGTVGPASRWAATSNVVVGQSTYPINRQRGRDGVKRSERETKSEIGGEGRMEWNWGGARAHN